MKHISKFSKFNEDHSGPEFRMPEEVTEEDWNKKGDFLGRVEFTTLEREFFMGFNDKNVDRNYHTEMYLALADAAVLVYNAQSGSYLCQIEIKKLDDDWYLIKESEDFYSVTKWYICDEWEEVLGYLSGCDYKFKLNI